MSSENPYSENRLQDALISVSALLSIAMLGWWAFTAELPSPDGSASLAPRPVPACIMDQEGYLKGSLYSGQQEQLLNWEGKDFRCDGMLRPQGGGIRLVFDQHLNEDEPGLVMIVGVDDAAPGKPANEAPANITLIDQVNGKLYSTDEQPRCWASFTDQQELTGTSEEAWRIDGLIFCQGPLTEEPRGNSRIRLGEIQFSGTVRPGLDN
ncbi:MAG: hypothetical protein ACR2QG_13615 [Gammaproteobacteria bacterium]